ncbi:MAG: hypothetical protein KC417_15400, partial [Myxococcales bacterium]|nr:hypothetical protein [Myxococcales bacterium]
MAALLGCSSAKTANPVRDASILSPDGGGDGGGGDGKAPESCDPPTHMFIEFLTDGTKIDLGYSGLSYGTTLNVGASTTVKITDCDSDCATNCRFVGPVAHPDPNHIDLRRCRSDTRKECSSDADCGTGECTYFLTSHSVSQLPVLTNLESALLLEFKTLDGADPWPIKGSVDLSTGRVDVTRVNLRVHQWMQGLLEQPAPGCDNDTTPNDGIPNGDCTGTVTGKCDVHGQPGQGPSVIKRSTSLDCPLPGVNDPSEYFDVDLGRLSTSGDSLEITDASPKCTDGGGKCWCGLCDDPPDAPCKTSRDCNGGKGTCGGGVSNAKIRYDGCYHDFEPASCGGGIYGAGQCRLNQAWLIDYALRCHPGGGAVGARIELEGAQSASGPGQVDSVLTGITCIPRT